MPARRPSALFVGLALALGVLIGFVASRARPPQATRIDGLPFVIDQPGRYALAGDLIGPPGAAAITIRASDVVLDLGGHRLEGSQDAQVGIQGAPGIERVEIRRGLVTLFSADGIDLGACSETHLENVVVSDTGGHGVVLGDRARLFECESLFNEGGRGFLLGDAANLRACRAIGTEYGGIYAGAGAVVIDCVAALNTYGDGMRLGPRAVVRGGSSRDNGGAGLRVGPRSSVSSILCENNIEVGIEVGPTTLVIECSVRNTLDGDGMTAGRDSSLRGCRSGRNQGDGFSVAPGAELRVCLALANQGHGIRASSGSALRENATEGNQADGIHLEGDGALLRGNSGRDNEYFDLYVLGSGHEIFANRARVGRYLVPESEPGQNAVGPWLTLAEAAKNPLANLLEPE